MFQNRKAVSSLLIILGLFYVVVSTNALTCYDDNIEEIECEGDCYMLYKIDEETKTAITIDRGCSDNIAAKCNEELHFCLVCNTPRCLFGGTLMPRTCIECSEDMTQCTRNPDSIETKTEDFACYTSSSANGANSRGSIRSRPEKCLSPLCRICTSNLCNNNVIPADRQQCSSKSGEKEICLNIKDKCWGEYDSDGILKFSGCYEEFEPNLCSSSNCMECSGHTCPPQVLQCLTCDESDQSCTINPDQVSSELCLNREDVCFTKTNPVSSRNSRGCGLSNVECGEDCKHCSINNCNNEIEPSTRTTCYNKEGLQERCLKLDDTCTGVYNAEGLLEVAGCSEELNTKCANEEALCLICGQQNKCSKKLLSCIKCSADDPACTINPTGITTRDLCGEEIEHCSIHVTAEGRNNRGCLKSVDECQENMCIKCQGDMCNTAIFPEIRTECYDESQVKRHCLNPVDQCTGLYNEAGILIEAGCRGEFIKDCIGQHCMICSNGPCAVKLDLLSCVSCESSNEVCTTNPSSLSSVECKLFENCFVKVDDNHKNSRGCLQQNEPCEGDSCMKCNENNCNAVPLPANRQQCIDNNEVSFCLNPDDLCVGVYEETGKLTKSGCETQLGVTCSPPFCIHCPTEGCAQTREPISCINCDAADDLCTTNPSGRATSICNIFEDCYVDVNNEGRNTRGCLTEDKCLDGKCHKCSSNKCNAEAFPITRRQCTGQDGQTFTCLNAEDVCKGVYDKQGQLLKVGCKEELSEDICTPELCRDCDDSGCSDQLRVCVQCKAEDITCTVNPNSSSSILCNSDEEVCFVNEKDGLNTRGCVKEEEEEGNICGEYNCLMCDENLCNNVVHPANRRQCYTCSGGKDCDRELKSNEDDNVLSICRNTTDKCFTKVVEAATTVRGCLQESEDLESKCPGDNCVICGENGCNNKFGIREAELSCYVCNSTNIGCGFSLDTNAISGRNCKGKVIMGQTEQCFSFKDNIIERGCVLELDLEEEGYKECADGTTCTLCETNKCNTNDINSALSIHAAVFVISSAVFFILLI